MELYLWDNLEIFLSEVVPVVLCGSNQGSGYGGFMVLSTNTGEETASGLAVVQANGNNN